MPPFRRILRLTLSFLLPLIAARLTAATLPSGFAETRVATGLNPTTITIAPDGRVFLCEKQGLLRVVEGERLLEQPCLDLSRQIDSWNERGLESVCFDPEFARNGWIYVYYTHNRDPHDATHESSNNRVSRFTVKGSVADPASELILLEIDNLSKIGWHNGGGMEFGADGKLYVSTGENANGPNAQDPKTILGKLLRINKDGTIPSDNPHYQEYSGNRRAIVALGLRNPFTIARNFSSGLLYLSVVGAVYEQIESYDSAAAPKALNYGWPDIDGPLRNGPLPTGYQAPVYAYDHGVGQAIALCGGDFYNPTAPGPDAFPARYRGKFFFTDYAGWIKLIDPAKPSERLDFATGINRAVDLATAPDGSLWYIERAGIPGGSDEANTASANGALWRVRWTGTAEAANADSTAKSSPVDAAAATAVAPLRIMPATGNFSGPVWLQLLSAVPNATIHYTRDGQTPDASSPTYTGPFKVDATSTIKAVAIKANGEVSGKDSAILTINGGTPYGIDYRALLSGVNLPATAQAGLPATLSATGLFAHGRLATAPGFVPYALNSAGWADNARVQHWVALPGSTRIGFAPSGEYTWPGGTVLVQHFEMVTDEATGKRRPLETRLLVLDQAGTFGYAANYRWRADGNDADLVAEAGEEEVLSITDASGARHDQTWTYPARELCYMCHTTNAGFVLGPKTPQLNGKYPYSDGHADNQLRTWNYLQMFSPALDEKSIGTLLRTSRIDDASVSFETRARSYVATNCAGCHRPNGTGAQWDARFEIPLASQGIIDGGVRNTLGVDDAKIVVPGHIEKSILYRRLASNSVAERMPIVTRNVVDQTALEVFKKWIESAGVKQP